nr:AraC family transcriptional regulator [Microvirga flocculans]
MRTRRLEVEPHGGGFSIKTVFSGQERYWFDGKISVVCPGEVLLVNPGETYASEIRTPAETDSFSLFFPRRWLEAEMVAGRAQALKHALDQGLSSLSLRSAPQLPQELRRLAEALASGTDPLALEEQMHCVSALAFAFGHELAQAVDRIDAADKATRGERLRRVLRARELVHASVAAGVSLADLAAAACMSEFHFIRAFRDAFGVTPAKYLERLRMQQAHALLQRTDLPVTEVARRCGYSSLSAFGRAFRRAWGKPAKTLRR